MVYQQATDTRYHPLSRLILYFSIVVCYHPLGCEAVAGRMSAALLEAVRGLHVADPDLGVKPLLAKLRGSSQAWERAPERCARR